MAQARNCSDVSFAVRHLARFNEQLVGSAADLNTIGAVSDVGAIVKRLAEVTDALLALPADDYASRFRLETERDELRAQAAEFHERKDEGRPAEDLLAELRARRLQLKQIDDKFVNRATQASARGTVGGGGEVPLGPELGGNINNAMRQAHGSASIRARVAELEQELARRANQT